MTSTFKYAKYLMYILPKDLEFNVKLDECSIHYTDYTCIALHEFRKELKTGKHTHT